MTLRRTFRWGELRYLVSLVLILLFGLLVRVPFWSRIKHPYSYDLLIYFLTGGNVLDGLNWYRFQMDYFYDYFNYHGIWYRLVFGGYPYPPLWGIICGLLAWLSDGSYRLFVQLAYRFYALCDSALAVSTYFLGRRYVSKKRALFASLLVIASPLFFASGEGKNDVLPTLFSVLSLILLETRLDLSAISIGICISFKYYGIVLLVCYLMWLIKSRGLRKALRFLFLAFTPPAILIIPFLLWDWEAYYFSLTFWASWCGNATPYGFVYKILDVSWRTTEQLWVNTTVTALYLASSISTLFALGAIMLTVRRETDLVKLTLSSLLCIYVFHKFIHPNYWSWAIPFLVVYALGKDSSILAWVAFASVSLSPFYNVLGFSFYGFFFGDLIRELVIPFLLLLLLVQIYAHSRSNGQNIQLKQNNSNPPA